MAVYVFNLLVGYLPNGIDNAQGYRAQMLKEFEKNVWHIFTELPGKREFDIYRKAGIDVHPTSKKRCKSPADIYCKISFCVRVHIFTAAQQV